MGDPQITNFSLKLLKYGLLNLTLFDAKFRERERYINKGGRVRIIYQTQPYNVYEMIWLNSTPRKQKTEAI